MGGGFIFLRCTVSFKTCTETLHVGRVCLRMVSPFSSPTVHVCAIRKHVQHARSLNFRTWFFLFVSTYGDLHGLLVKYVQYIPSSRAAALQSS